MSPKQIRDMFVSSYLPTLQQANEILEHDCFYDLEPGQQEILSSTLDVKKCKEHLNRCYQRPREVWYSDEEVSQ